MMRCLIRELWQLSAGSKIIQMDSQESLKIDMCLAWISDLQNNLYVLEVLELLKLSTVFYRNDIAPVVSYTNVLDWHVTQIIRFYQIGLKKQMKANFIEESRKKNDARRFIYIILTILWRIYFLTITGMNRNYNRIKIGINISLRFLFLILKEIIIIEKSKCFNVGSIPIVFPYRNIEI